MRQTTDKQATSKRQLTRMKEGKNGRKEHAYKEKA